MRKNSNIIFATVFALVFVLKVPLKGQTFNSDTILIKEVSLENTPQLSDSLNSKTPKKKLIKLFNDLLISPPRPYVDKEAMALNYYSRIEGKVISGIDITALDVFGPNFNDTARKTKNWAEKAANSIHTKSNLNTIKKLFLFNVGDTVNSEILYESERIIRSLSYIKDLKILYEIDSLNTNNVNLHVITQDRFSMGVSGGVSGTNSADAGIYNQNIFGVGHEISFRFVGHLQRQPYMGLETFYKIKNIKGKFIDISAGYMNTYRQEGFSLVIDKPFFTPSVKWGFGSNAIRFYRTDRIFENDPIQTQTPIDLSFLSAWAGRSFQIKPKQSRNAQMVLSAGFYNRTYYERPILEPGSDNQYFSNSTFYLTGITFTQRRFVQDQLVYSYGVTEDIPEGFKNEIVYGFDANEFGNRHYAHLYLSNGNLLINRKGYLYLSAGIGGYFNGLEYEQGQIQGSLNFISRRVDAGSKRFRFFAKANYMIGLRRFEIEDLSLRGKNHIRGFGSRYTTGKQRLSADFEYVLFLRKEFYKFNMAIFSFADIGVIGSNKQLIFAQDYYSGIGLGVRLHNENLVFRTFHLRLAFYPFHPSDMSFVGFILDEQSKQRFYNFEPSAPLPLRFE